MGNLSSLTYNYIKIPMPIQKKKGRKRDTLKKRTKTKARILAKTKGICFETLQLMKE